MKKQQKIWLGIFLAMFVVPEVLFSFLVSSIASMFSKNFPFLYQVFIRPQFFVDNSGLLFFALAIEWVGVLGLIIWNIKFNGFKSKKIITALFLIILIWLTIIFLLGYVISNINFF